MDASASTLWNYWAEGDFRLQRCAACERFQHPPGRLCAHCHGSDMIWSSARREGTVVSWSVVHRAPLPAFADLTPYTIALVEVADGPLVELWFVGPDPEPQIGQPVAIEIRDVAGRQSPVAVPAQG